MECPVTFLDGGCRPAPEHLSGLIDHEFSRAGLILSNSLWSILKSAWETKFDAASTSSDEDGLQQTWLSKLFEWRAFAGFTASTLLAAIEEKVRFHENDYYNTKPFSIYMWWRICKMVADIEVVASHSSKAKFDHLLDYLSFVITLERDTRALGLAVRGSRGCCYNVPERCGTFKKVQDPDLFPELDATPACGDPAIVVKSRAAKIHWKLRLFFKQCPISYEDFLLTASILSAYATLGTGSGKARHPRRPYQLPRSSGRPYELPRPFKRWRDWVRAAVDTPEIGRLVTRIYQMLIGHPGTPTIRVLCQSLWDLLGTTPKLFRAFELLVPGDCLEVWHVESKLIQVRQSTPSKTFSLKLPCHLEQSASLQDSVHLRGGADEDGPLQPQSTVQNINNTFNINA